MLLLAAIGVGVYFYFSKNKSIVSSNPKRLVLGKWKLDSVVEKVDESSMFRDGPFSKLYSTLKNYEIEFQNDILISQTRNGETRDTSHYKFYDKKNLSTWGRNDTAKAKWGIQRVGSANLILRDQDSTLFYLRRVK